MVWNQQTTVNNPAHSVINPFGLREGSVSTFMGQNPAPSAKKTLDNRVRGPCHNATRQKRNHVDVRYCQVAKQTQEKHISGQIGETPESRSLITVLGNSVQDFLDSNFGSHKLSSVRVKDRLILIGRGRRRVWFHHAWSSMGDRSRRHC